MPGFLADPARWIGHFDIFALSSDSEQFPISLVEAMAAGLPAVATAVGDVPAIVSDDNRPLIVEPDDEAAFAAALDSLADRRDLRRAIGAANREKAAADYDEKAMIARLCAALRRGDRPPRRVHRGAHDFCALTDAYAPIGAPSFWRNDVQGYQARSSMRAAKCCR